MNDNLTLERYMEILQEAKSQFYYVIDDSVGADCYHYLGSEALFIVPTSGLPGLLDAVPDWATISELPRYVGQSEND